MARRKISNKKTTTDSPVYANYVDRLESKVQSNQSKLSMILGALIILVVGILVFNFFNRGKADLGPAQQKEVQEDVSPQSLPGNYTVKQDDTLFTISEKYYGDGYKYVEVAQANNLTNPDQIETGQVLKMPKLESVASTLDQTENLWGEKITGDSYTVVWGDWLSKIAGRAYGDIYAYERIAKANNIQNPDLIEPGMVLSIPR
ncbi:LysM peptidoglycan-binding domain-containing protein [Candidatus Daviesbacteria bacterium]|nr:LysM peptidoglycan-binding domain-containing protein [Candidatus Daviesbacteria bacterium]